MADLFEDRRGAWTAYVTTPWARIRYAVVEHVLSQRLLELGPGPHRILDVGGGDGLDSVPLAIAGHDVTVLDPSESMLADARSAAGAGGAQLTTIVGGLEALATLEPSYDLVLCHFVLHYRDPSEPDLERLLGVVRPGGLVSIAVPNPATMTLRRLVTDGPAAALEEQRRDTVHNHTFDTENRKVDLDAVQAQLETLGATPVGRYSARIASDLLTEDGPKQDPAYFADLLALELALHDREPFCRLGATAQLVVRVSPGSPVA